MEVFSTFKNKIIILTIVVLLANFIFAKPVSAKSFSNQGGGKLFEPICDLLIFVRRLCNGCFTVKLFN